MSLNGKVALVTGAGSGIGLEVALEMARRGARVGVVDISGGASESAVRAIRELGGEAVALQADVAAEADVERLVAATVERWGRLDVACNNAGIGGASAPTGEYTAEAWNRVIDVNLSGVYRCMRHEIPAMLESGGGSIVNVSSILGHVGFANAPAYVAAKHGVLGLTKTAAVEYATRGIRVNAVSPGFIATPLLEKAGLLEEGSPAHEAIVGLHPMRRMGTVQEVASAVCWLASDEASFVTGASLLVDGGYTAV